MKSKKSKNFEGNPGISIILIQRKMEELLRKENSTNENKRNVKNQYASGKLKANEMKNIAKGLGVLQMLMDSESRKLDLELVAGEQDVSKTKKAIAGYKGIIEDILRSMKYNAIDEGEIKQRIENLPEYTQILGAARRGVLVKKEKQKLEKDGKEQEIIVDVPMTPKEVYDTLDEYERMKYEKEISQLQNYMNLGLSVAGILGTLMPKKIEDDNEKNKTGKTVALGTTAITALKLMRDMVSKKNTEKLWDFQEMKRGMIDDLLGNEQISNNAIKDAIKNIEEVAKQESRENIIGENK